MEGAAEVAGGAGPGPGVDHGAGQEGACFAGGGLHSASYATGHRVAVASAQGHHKALAYQVGVAFAGVGVPVSSVPGEALDAPEGTHQEGSGDAGAEVGTGADPPWIAERLLRLESR